MIKYIERVRENILEVDDNSIEKASKLLNEAGSILLYGAGRSFLALKIGLGQISNFKVISCPKDAGFPGIDELIERHGKIAVLMASGSGTTETTIEALNDIIKEKEIMDEVSIIGITSHSESEFGKLISSEFEGDKVIINLKGKTKDDENDECDDGFIVAGIMGDQFELGVLSLCQRIAEQMYLNRGIENIDYSEFPGKIKEATNENFDGIKWAVSNIIESDEYWSIIDKIISRCSVIFGGVRYSSMVGSIAAIRLMHLKRVLGDEVFVYQMENTPKSRFGDLAIIISASGGAEGILSSVKEFEKLGTEVLAITGSRDSRLASIADYNFILDEEPSNEKISPLFSKKTMSSFYEKASYLLSVMPIHAREELKTRGYNITEEMMKTMHPKD